MIAELRGAIGSASAQQLYQKKKKKGVHPFTRAGGWGSTAKIVEFDRLEEAARESAARQSCMQRWLSRPDCTEEFVTCRVWNGKSSPGGLTAEMFRQLPEEELVRREASIQDMFRSLSFEASWTVITASLVPKKAVTRALSDMRPISGLCHICKLLGHIWMDALPPLQWMAPQSRFVRGRQLGEAAFVLSVVSEGAKEWATPVYVGQLDLRHAVLNALLQKASPNAADCCDIFHLCTGVSTALAYTFAGPLCLKQNGVFTFVTTSGCTDQHTAHSHHIGSGTGYRSFRQLTIRSSRELHGGRRHLLVPGSGRKRQDLLVTK